MKWNVNIIGENHVWYSQDVINRIVEHIDNFCSKCPYAEVEEDVCNNYCLLDDITKPIIEIINEDE